MEKSAQNNANRSAVLRAAIVANPRRGISAATLRENQLKSGGRRCFAFAFLSDTSRRFGVRVAKVEVVNRFDALGGVEVAELGDGYPRTPHFLPMDRLAALKAPAAKRRFAQFFAVSRDRRSLPVAGQTGQAA